MEVLRTASITDPLAIAEFITGGNATFTVQGRESHFTYRVRVAKDRPNLFFVSVLVGSDNESDYAYIGTLRMPGLAFDHGRKSKIAANAPSVVAFAWLTIAVAYRLPTLANVGFYHEGRCGRCARKLTTPESVMRGFGPECVTRVCEAA